MRFFCFILIFLAFDQVLAAEAVDITAADFQGQPLGKRSYWYVGDEDIETVTAPEFQSKFVRGTNERHGFSRKENSFWVRIHLLNPRPYPYRVYVHDTYVLAKELSVYKGKSLIGSLGHDDPLWKRIVEIELPPQSETPIFLKRTSYAGQRQTWTYWSDKEQLIDSIQRSERNFSVVASVLAMSFFFNLMLYFAYRSRSYLIYIAWLTTSTLGSACMSSLISGSHVFLIANSLFLWSFVLGGLFTLEFINLDASFRKTRRLFLLIIGITVANQFILFYAPELANRILVTIAGVLPISALLASLLVYIKRREAHVLIYLFAYGSLLLGVIAQTIVWQGLIPTLLGYENIGMYSLVIENIFIIIAMGNQIYVAETDRKNSHKELQKYVGNVEALVNEKTIQIRMLLDHIPQGVMSVEANAIIGKNHSAHLESILEMIKPVGRSIREVLLARCEISPDIQDQIFQVLCCAIGENPVSYAVNVDKLPGDLVLLVNGTRKYLKLTWNPLVIDDSVVSILLTILDISAEKMLEEQNRVQSQEVLRLIELASISEKAASRFFATGRTLLDAITEVFDGVSANISLHDSKIVFVNAHTLKGAARTLGLKELASKVHETEEVLSLSIKNQLELDKRELEPFVAKIRATFDAYENINSHGLKRSVNFSHVLVERSLIENHCQFLAEMLQKPAYNIGSFIKELEAYHRELGRTTGSDLVEIIEDYREKAGKIARDLGKPEPEFVVHAPQISIRNEVQNTLDNCMIHLLRNSLDHGIEDVAERLRMGKPAAGRIFLDGKVKDSMLQLVFRDDGRGLAIERLQKKGRELHSHLADGRFPDIAELMFMGGASTAENVTDISGRGIGMMAVRNALKDIGGTIRVELGKPKDAGFYDFAFLIELPLADPGRNSQVA